MYLSIPRHRAPALQMMHRIFLDKQAVRNIKGNKGIIIQDAVTATLGNDTRKPSKESMLLLFSLATLLIATVLL